MSLPYPIPFRRKNSSSTGIVCFPFFALLLFLFLCSNHIVVLAAVYGRERANNAYDTFSYLFAKLFSEIPLNMLPPVVFGTIIYFIVGLDTSKFGEFLGILMAVVLTAISLGMMVSSFSKSPEMATAISVPLMVLSLLFAGFYSKFFYWLDSMVVFYFFPQWFFRNNVLFLFLIIIVNVDSIPIVINLLPYISLIRWSFEVNIFTFVFWWAIVIKMMSSFGLSGFWTAAGRLFVLSSSIFCFSLSSISIEYVHYFDKMLFKTLFWWFIVVIVH